MTTISSYNCDSSNNTEIHVDINSNKLIDTISSFKWYN